jgi:hypothetical protein
MSGIQATSLDPVQVIAQNGISSSSQWVFKMEQAIAVSSAMTRTAF